MCYQCYPFLRTQTSANKNHNQNCHTEIHWFQKSIMSSFLCLNHKEGKNLCFEALVKVFSIYKSIFGNKLLKKPGNKRWINVMECWSFGSHLLPPIESVKWYCGSSWADSRYTTTENACSISGWYQSPS